MDCPDDDLVKRRAFSYLTLVAIVLLGAIPVHRVRWTGSAELHTLIETCATLLAYITGVMALVRYYAKKSTQFLFVGCGFLGASLLDGYHAAVTSTFLAERVPSFLSAFSSWSGLISRVVLSTFMLAGLLFGKVEEARPFHRLKERTVYILAGAWTLLGFLFFALTPLPSAFRQEFFLHRPGDLVPAILFSLTAIGCLQRGLWKTNIFEHWLVLSLIAAAADHVPYMAFYSRQFGAQYFAAHFLKILGYGLALTGLLANTYSAFKREAEIAGNLSHANQSLAFEIGERRRAEADLRRAHDELDARVRARTADLANANRALRSEVTERRRVEDTLSAERQALRALIDNVPDFMYVKDTHSRFLLANRPVARQMGKDGPDELLGRTDFDFYPRDLAKAFHDDEQQVMRTGESLLNHEETGLDRLGNKTFILTTKVPLRDKDGKVIGIAGVGRDISGRKQAEAEMERAREAAEAASRAKNEFLANMSHEIRTPMNGIIGMTDLALETELTDEQRRYLDLVKSSAASLLSLIDDILDFSKIEAGKLDLETIPFQLRESLDDTVRMLQVRAHQKGNALICRVGEDVPDGLLGDPTRLRQIVVNLVGNAIKFTPQGAVEVRVERHRGTGEELRLHFAIIDTGIGIPADKLQSIFEAFTQADNSVTRKFGGTGLGLAICSHLAGMMGGRIWVESEVEKGSVFHFELPFRLKGTTSCEPASGAQPAEKSCVVKQPHRSLNLLLAEDNPVNQALAVRILEKRGYGVVVADTGRMALEMLEKDSFDMVLMDVQMPEMDGLLATARIREREKLTGRHVPIIAMTAHAMVGDRERCLAAGMDAYVSKPLQVNELLSTIERLAPAVAAAAGKS